MNTENEQTPPPHYVWPRFVLAGVILAILLAILWMSFAVRRTRQLRDSNPFLPETKPTAPLASTNHRTGPIQGTPDPLANVRGFLSGGNPETGRKIFFEKPEANCGKCHRVNGQGGDSGPALDGAGSRQTRDQILEAILFPNRQTTANFETVIVLLKNGSGRAGILKSEDERQLVLNTPEEGPVTINKSDIQLRQKGASPMPENIVELLSQQDLRNLVEFVAGLK
jgi:putative heme-binding domain-containing protein